VAVDALLTACVAKHSCLQRAARTVPQQQDIAAVAYIQAEQCLNVAERQASNVAPAAAVAAIMAQETNKRNTVHQRCCIQQRRTHAFLYHCACYLAALQLSKKQMQQAVMCGDSVQNSLEL
jgi:hypothetical protein